MNAAQLADLIARLEKWAHGCEDSTDAETDAPGVFLTNTLSGDFYDTLKAAAAELRALGGGVDLEQFRDAVTAWKHEGERRWTDSAGTFHMTVGPNHYRAMALMDVIDKAQSPAATVEG